jgi:methylated-DNA-[protein]-cysteine S-methyltransferase
MSNTLYYTIFKTKLGWVGILATKAGLQAVTLPQNTQKQVFNSLGEQAKRAVLSKELFCDFEQRLKDYYSGKKHAFSVKLDFSNASAFQKLVWQAARLIPYGETRSYGWIARQIGKPKAARAVGQALGKNPLLIVVPCHRVIAGDGTLGGFGGGLAMKKTLMELEKAEK